MKNKLIVMCSIIIAGSSLFGVDAGKPDTTKKVVLSLKAFTEFRGELLPAHHGEALQVLCEGDQELVDKGGFSAAQRMERATILVDLYCRTFQKTMLEKTGGGVVFIDPRLDFSVALHCFFAPLILAEAVQALRGDTCQEEVAKRVKSIMEEQENAQNPPKK